MAIDAYVGKPGHGKSYGVTEHVIIPSVKEGRHVVTNIPLEREELLADFGAPGAEVTQLPEDWFERPDMADLCPPGCVLVLDELWRRWPAGLKANQALLVDKALLAEHRHRVDDKGRSMRIVLVSQDLSQLAAWVRILIEQTYRMTKLTAIGSSKKFRVDIYQGAPTGDNVPKSRLIRQTFGQYRKEVYKYYKSATQSATGNVGDESKADRRGSVWRSPFIIFSIFGPIIGIPFLVWKTATIFGSGIGMAEPPPEPVGIDQAALVNPPPPTSGGRPAAVPATVLSAIPVNAAPPTESAIWRVAGSISRSTQKADVRWSSVHGYNAEPEPSREFMADQVLLRSVHGSLRYVPASECVRFPDGINWRCEVDGELVTPWTGRGGSTQWAQDGTALVGKTAAVAGSNPDPSPPPSAQRL